MYMLCNGGAVGLVARFLNDHWGVSFNYVRGAVVTLVVSKPLKARPCGSRVVCSRTIWSALVLILWGNVAVLNVILRVARVHFRMRGCCLSGSCGMERFWPLSAHGCLCVYDLARSVPIFWSVTVAGFFAQLGLPRSFTCGTRCLPDDVV